MQETYETNLSSWDVEFVKSFPDFNAFSKWDSKRKKPMLEDELKAVYDAIVPAKETQGNAMTSFPIAEKKTVETINPENEHGGE